MTQSSLAELLAALEADELTLPQVLQALNARGPVSPQQHRDDTEVLDRTTPQGVLAGNTLQQLRLHLDRIQHAEGAAAATDVPRDAAPRDDTDATVVTPQGSVPPEDADATVVTPQGSVPPEDADATVVTPQGSVPPGDADATVVTPQGSVPPEDADATVVTPRGSVPPEDADATVVKPSTPPAGDTDGATVVQPTSARPTPLPPGTTGTGTGTGTQGSGSSRASWQRVASAEGGEYATVGMLLKGRFLLEREIGRGGMGVVFLARDERKVEARDRDPYVAVKVLNDEFRRHPDSLIALQRESRRSQQLAHDNIVRVFDFDKDGTIVFMTMEYVDGSDLKTLIRERAYDGLPLAEARALIEGMARALQRAHGAGVVHSDFKPGNVMVTRDGVPKVFDFGIARAGKHAGDVAGEQTVFDAGTLGALTPAYASLEMIQGRDPTPRDDIYALGCVAFELLTGRHPFDKVSAEVANREGRKPPAVKGLTRRQYKALCDAVAFHGEQRLRSVGELVEGLRDVGWRERFGPYLLGGAGLLVLLAAGGWGTRYYLHEHHLKQVAARFALSNPHHYANEDVAVAALRSLAPQDRGQLVLNKAELIQNYLLSRVDQYWDPQQGRYDYARAQHVFTLRDQLKLFSPKLDARRQAIEQQRNTLLNHLDTQLSQRIAAGAIFPGQPKNVVQTLKEIRAIDPRSSLLDNAELELKYDIAIGRSLAAGKVEQARSQLKVALAQFPQSSRLALRSKQLAAIGGGAPAPEIPAMAAMQPGSMSAVQARKALNQLLAQPSAASAWQRDVGTAVAALGKAHLPAATREHLGRVVAELAGRQTDALHLPDDQQLVAFGLRYAPHSKPLRERKAQLDTLLKQQQAKLDREAASAEVTSRIESLRRAAAADDLSKARESLARIRSLDPTNAFLKSTGPKLLSGAYLRSAETRFRAGHAGAAVQLLGQALQQLGQRPELVHAHALYGVGAALLAAHGQPLGPVQYLRLHRQLTTAAHADPDRLKQVEATLKARGTLQHGSLSAWLQALQPGAGSAPASASTLAQAAAAAAAPTPAASPTAGAASKATAAAQAAASAQSAAHPAATTATAHAPANTAAADPCARPGLAGHGRVCFDHLRDGHRGPSMVVIPGLHGGHPYAMTRVEVTVGEYNLYCRSSHQCSPQAVSDREAARLPVTGISIARARAYARWLSQASGHTYRLPTDAEWLHAAHAGRGWSQSPDSNCLPPSSDGSDGSGGPISARGRQPNPWGLINLTGNVWEWVTKGSSLQVRGGSYNSYWSDCTVANHRADSGAAQKDVGLRLLREIR